MSTKVRAKKAKIFMQAELDNNKKLQFYIIEQMVLKKKETKKNFNEKNKRILCIIFVPCRQP